MPLYEYRCTSCGYGFEKIQSFSAAPETVCPKCQGALIRPVTAPALRFEGAGWYVNDYAGKGAAKGAANAADTATTASDTKTESKPAAASASSGDSAASTAAPAAAPAAPSSGTSGN